MSSEKISEIDAIFFSLISSLLPISIPNFFFSSKYFSHPQMSSFFFFFFFSSQFPNFLTTSIFLFFPISNLTHTHTSLSLSLSLFILVSLFTSPTFISYFFAFFKKKVLKFSLSLTPTSFFFFFFILVSLFLSPTFISMFFSSQFLSPHFFLPFFLFSFSFHFTFPLSRKRISKFKFIY